MGLTVDILIDGTSVFGRLADRLLSLTVTDEAGSTSDSASMSFDNAGGVIASPRKGAVCRIVLGGIAIFEGTVDTVQSRIDRGSGRVLLVGALGADMTGSIKVPQNVTFPQGSTVQSVMQQAAARAGVETVRVAPGLASLIRDREVMDGESFIAFGNRLAREIGATFKVRGPAAIMARRGAGQSPTGGALPTIRAVVGDNLISGNLTPYGSRSRCSKVVVRYHDLASGRWEAIEKPTGIVGADANAVARYTAPDRPSAEQKADAMIEEAKDGGGQGSVELMLNPLAMPEATVAIVGWGPAEDGIYRASSVTHRVDRSGGGSTIVQLKRPGADE